jgi:Mrp family chromosome partitioning ATPase
MTRQVAECAPVPTGIAVYGLKGGIGKSTVAATVACGFHRTGRKTTIADAGSQGTLGPMSAGERRRTFLSSSASAAGTWPRICRGSELATA